jgi:WD40 repeat protein
VASGKNQNEITLLDTPRGRLVRTLTGAPDLWDVVFSHDASQIAAVSKSQLLTWDVTSGRPTRSIPIGDAYGVQLDSTASRAYVTDPHEGTLVTWDLDGLSSYLRQEKALPNLDGGFYRPAADGVHVASYTGNSLDLVNERTGTVSPVRDARKISFFDPGSWRPDGRRFVLGTADGYVQVFDDAGRLRTEARVARASVTDVDYASGGRTIAVSDVNGKVALLDASTLSAAGTPVQLDGPVAGVTLAPDGRTAFVVTHTGSWAPATMPGFEGWTLLDLRSGSRIRTGRLPESAWAFDDFSPDGVHVAAGFFGGRIWIVDTRTGRSVGATATNHVSILWLGWSPDGSPPPRCRTP